MIKLRIAIATLVIAIVGVAFFPANQAAAESVSCRSHFLGVKTWYDGLTDSSCNIKSPVEVFPNEEAAEEGAALRMFIWTIVMNVVSMILGVVGYLAIGMIIYGGFLYMTAQGNPSKLAAAKNTIVRSVIGLAIIMSASIISGAVADIISGANKDPDFVTSLLTQAFIWMGIIAVIMMIWGGIQYITSTGNASNLQKAKSTILYAAIGLLIVIFAAVIVNTVLGAMGA